jgi:hypothetical protein
MNQPPVQQEFRFPNGRCPSVILLIAAIANLVCFIAVGARTGIWVGTEWPGAIIFYGIAGILGALGSFNSQRHPGIAIGTIVMSVFSLAMAFSQVRPNNLKQLLIVLFSPKVG